MLYRTLIENNVQVNNIFFPTSIMIKLTNRCNLNCTFCSQGDAKNVDIDFETVKKVLEEAKRYGVCEVAYSGGEPLLYPEFKKVIDLGKSLGLYQVLVTNGVNIDKYFDDILTKVDNIGISLHGNEEIHDEVVVGKGTYQKVKANIERLNQYENGPIITLNFTISERNVNAIDDVAKFAKDHKCKLSVARLNQIGRSSENSNIQSIINQFFEQLSTETDIRVSNVIPICQMASNKKHLCHSCSAGLASVCIEADSTVKICASSTHSLGTIKVNSLFEIWNNQEFMNFRSLQWVPEVCKTCRDYAKCLGGCKAEKYKNPYTFSKDCLMAQAVEEFYEKCKKQKMVISFTNVRKIDNQFLLIGRPNRIVDEEGMLLIKTLMKTKDATSLFEKMDEDVRKKALELLYGMHKDGLLLFV